VQLCGLSTDTGQLRFSQHTPALQRRLPDLVQLGADPAEVALSSCSMTPASARPNGSASRCKKMEKASRWPITWDRRSTAQDFDTAQAGDEGSENVETFLR
jgi:nanoRNase/pAp phosphatase (c-di-AMP/oligoRNAs hydrolase)